MNISSPPTNESSLARRPLTLAQRNWLLDELKRWQQLGLVSAERVDDILNLYETPRESAARQHSVAVFTLLALAALFVGLAALLLIGYNWEDMPAALKLTLVFGVVLATHCAGFYLRFAMGGRRSSEVVFFLGCLFYGAAIWLIAQIFHLNAHYPDGFWWWAVGILPFALCLDTVLLHLLLVGVLAAWVGTEVLGFADLGMWFFRRWNWFPNGAYSLLPFAGLGLLWAYRKPAPAVAGLYVALVTWWVVLQPFAWHLHENPIYFIGSAGALLLVLAELHRPHSLFAIPYRLWGTLLALGALVPLSYSDWHDRGDDPMQFLVQTLVIAALAIVIVTVVLLHRRQEDDGGGISRPVHAFLVRQWLPLALVLLMAFLSGWAGLMPEGAAAGVPTVLANLAMLAAAYWLATLGLQEDRGRPFVAGVAYFLLWAVLRYIDLFGGAGGMLGAALMFFLCGAAVFGVAMFWNHRSKKEISHA